MARRVLVAGILVLMLTGCTRLQEAAMPVTAKVNAAHPVVTEVRVAQERLATLLQGDTSAVTALQSQSENRMNLRALNCSKSATISRFASIATVKALSLDPGCFQEQDVDLLRFYGVRTIGVLLDRPPLRPLKRVGPIVTLPRGKLANITTGAVARDAGVAYVQDTMGDGAVVELPGAALIAMIGRSVTRSSHDHRLSPNGRLLSISEGNRTIFYEAETGSKIWESGAGSRFIEWLPHVTGLLLTNQQGGLTVYDGLLGTGTEESLVPRHSSYAASIPGSTPRTLVGTSHHLVLLAHARTATGITSMAHKQLEIRVGQGVTSGEPVPMRSGRLVVYASMRDIGWLDLDTGASGTWRTSGFFGIPFAKLDEKRIMIDSPEGQVGLKPWAFDIEAQTVSPLDLGGPRGLIVDIGDRIGFLRRGNDSWFGDEAKAGAAEPVDKVVAAAELERQIAKLQAMSPQGGLPGVGFGRPPLAEALGQPRQQPVPGLEGVPKDAQVHIVGVYEGKRAPGLSDGGRKREVRVVVRRTDHPVVLVLAGYEPVAWNVTNTGARIAAVLLSGDSSSTASGVGPVPVLRIGHHFAYSSEGAEYLQLRQAVSRYTASLPIRTFQGAYAGSDFAVGGY